MIHRIPFYNKLMSLPMLFCLILYLAGCGSSGVDLAGGGTETGNPQTPTAALALSSFEDEAAMEKYLKAAYAENALPSEAYQTEKTTDDNAMPPVNAPNDDAGYYPGYDPDGVEGSTDDGESVPVVLADGPYLYVAAGNAVNIVQTEPTMARTVSTDAMAVEGVLNAPGNVRALFLNNGVLAAIYVPEGGAGTIREELQATQGARVGTPYWIPSGARTGVLLADVSDPVEPQIIHQAEFDGLLTAARRYGDDLNLAIQFLPDLPDLTFQYEDDGTEPADAFDSNSRQLANVPVENLLPHYDIRNADGTTVASGRLMTPENLYRPAEKGGGSIVSLLTFHLNSPEMDFDCVGVAADIHGIRMAEDAVYLAGIRWQGQAGTAASPYVTDIIKIAVSPKGLQPKATGSVEGRLLGPLALGASRGTLQIATALTETDGVASTIGVFLLETDNNLLTTIGSINHVAANFGPTAARFNGAMGWIAETSGPLTLLDLSRPQEPRILGKLPLHGRLLSVRHLEDAHLLIASSVGQTGDNGNLAIWATSNSDDPVLLHELPVTAASMGGYGWAIDLENMRLALPVSRIVSGDESNATVFKGIQVYAFSVQTGFDNLGELQSPVDPSIQTLDIGLQSVFMGNTVYTITVHGIRAAGIADMLSPLGTLWFNTL